MQRKIRLTTIGPLVILLILMVVFSIIFVISIQVNTANIQQGVDDVSLPVMNITSELLFNPLYNLDITGIGTILDPYVDGTTTVYATVYDANGKQIVEINKKWAPDIAISSELSHQALSQTEIVRRVVGDYLILTKSIAASGVSIGTVEIVFDQAPLQASLGQAQTTMSITLIVALIMTAFLLFILFQYALSPLNRLANVAKEISGGNLSAKIPQEGSEEISFLASALNNMVETVRTTISTLEQRIAERTHSLELAAEVGRSVSQVRSLDVMLKDAAELIRSRFDLYYVQVYLTNPSQTALVLQSGTGTVGAQLAGRGHQLPLNTASINGRAAIEKHSVVISDTTTSATFKPNPLLPDTQSEVAIPLLIGERVVGVLDLQSQKAGALNQEGLTAFEALAGQLAIAIQNATFLAETEQARAEVESQARRLSRTNWVDYLDAIHQPEETGFVFEQNKISPITGQSTLTPNENALTASIAVTGEALGNLVVEMAGPSPIARTDELVHTVARQVAQQIESLRLLDSAERYRFEAEEASRRLTRESWQDYAANVDKSMSYFYDLKEVRPYTGQNQPDEGLALPLKVRDETVGQLVVQGLESSDDEAMSLATVVAERLGAHIESLRQFEETKRGQIELDKRARQLAAVAEISSVSSRELDTDKMLVSVVHLTQRKFGLYHAHVLRTMKT
jgi:GAF domain-containing protein/HAMP domain-containing protein